MAEQEGSSWACDRFLFCNIFKVFRISIQPGRFFLAFAAVAILLGSGWLMDFSRTVVVNESSASRPRTSRLASRIYYPTELHCFVAAPDRVEAFIERHQGKCDRQGVFRVYSTFCMNRFHWAVVSAATLKFDHFASALMGCVYAGQWALRYHTVYSMFFILIFLVVFSVFGGAICRSAAMQFSMNQSPSAIESLKFSLKKYISFFCVLLTPIVFFAIFGIVFILLIGLMANIPWVGEIILALLFVIVLLAGLLMTFMIIGSAAGINIMFGALAFEDSNTFDAFSRAFIYIYSKPWRYGFYCLTAAFYGMICYLFVRFFAFLMLTISRSFLSMIMWTDSGKSEAVDKLDLLWPCPHYFNLTGFNLEHTARLTESFSAFVIHLEILLVAGLVIAFAVSFYFSASTVIYSLMRKVVDRIDIGQVYNEPEKITAESTEFMEESDGSEQVLTPEQPE